MDRRTLTRQQALDVVREYKQVIRPRYKAEPKVMMYGSYAKGYANPDRKVNVLIEPVLMEDEEDSPHYREVMRTGVSV